MKRLLQRSYVLTCLGLLALLAGTCASAFIPLGSFNLVCNLLIAAAKALLVAVFFMKVLKAGPVVCVVALAGMGWLALLVILSLNDFALRSP